MSTQLEDRLDTTVPPLDCFYEPEDNGDDEFEVSVQTPVYHRFLNRHIDIYDTRHKAIKRVLAIVKRPGWKRNRAVYITRPCILDEVLVIAPDERQRQVKIRGGAKNVYTYDTFLAEFD